MANIEWQGKKESKKETKNALNNSEKKKMKTEFRDQNKLTFDTCSY